MNTVTLVDLIRPSRRVDALIYDIILVISGSILLALSAQISVPVPFSPVPITGQTFGVMLLAALLGSKRGALAVVAYLLEGIGGLPVFANAGFGFHHLLGPTGGYLIGFVPAAFLIGYFAEKGWDRNFLKIAIALIFGNAVIFTCGLSWLSIITGSNNVMAIGLYPFISGSLLKIFFVIVLLPTSWRLVGLNKNNN